MYILAFSLDWFTTIPGILITLGVVLLIIAVILFVTGNKKDNKGNSVVNNQVAANNQESVQAVNVTPNLDTTNVSSNLEAINVTPNVDNINVTPAVEAVTSNSTVEPITIQEPVESKFEDISIGTPGVDPINSVDTTVVNTNEISEQVVTPVENVLEINTPEVSLDQTMVSVYGGEDPISTVQPIINEESKTTTIYGGNDPLEATQRLPKVEEHHEPYGGAMNEVKIVEPLDETVIEIPEVEPVVAAPIEVETPAVEEKEVSFEIPVAPVEIPEANVEIPTIASDTLPASEEKTSVEEL